MKLIKNSDKAWDHKTGYSKKVFLTAAEMKAPGTQIQELLIKPGVICDNHYHKAQTEIFYFPQANGWFEVNGVKADLSNGDILVLEPNDWHRAGNESSKDFRYICFKLRYPGSGDFFDK